MNRQGRPPVWASWILTVLILVACASPDSEKIRTPDGPDTTLPVPVEPTIAATEQETAVRPATSRPTQTPEPVLGDMPRPTTIASETAASPVQPPRTREIEFTSGPFNVVGSLKMPAGEGPYPVVLFVHGDGPNDRVSGGTYRPIMARMGNAGYATFAWDKPGTGESTGQIDRSRLGEQRAQIVLDAIEVMKKHPEIDAQRIGLWGISQAGYVMPRVLQESEDVAFMIAISNPGVAGVEQGAYLVAAQAICAGIAAEDAGELRRLLSEIETAPTYEAYVQIKEALDALLGIEFASIFGYRPGVRAEEEWHVPDPEGEYFWDPIEVIKQVTIPVLAFFGERDTQVDPILGARLYQEALESAGNPNFRIELIPGTDHNIILSETGCLDERENRSRGEWTNYAPEYLDILEEWLSLLQS